MFKAISKDVRDQILVRIKENGEKVSVVAQQYGISVKTVYAWLSSGTVGVRSSVLASNKLRRENLQLKQMIGELMLQKKQRRGL